MHDAPAAPLAVATGGTGESYSYWCLELKNSDTGYTVSACLIHVQHLPSSCYHESQAAKDRSYSATSTQDLAVHNHRPKQPKLHTSTAHHRRRSPPTEARARRRRNVRQRAHVHRRRLRASLLSIQGRTAALSLRRDTGGNDDAMTMTGTRGVWRDPVNCNPCETGD